MIYYQQVHTTEGDRLIIIYIQNNLKLLDFPVFSIIVQCP
jgi:hypothetical protein